ncbi:MAG: hypothetical protein ACYC7H_10390 [Chloroflexota bacterium]
MLEYLSSLPPWLILAAAFGGAVGSLARLMLPRWTPDLFRSAALFAIGLSIGHLVALVGDLPGWQLGDLRLFPGLALGVLLILLARSERLW